VLAHEAGQRFPESPPGGLQSARVDQGAGHATDRSTRVLEALRWRTKDEPPPSAVRLASPSDLEARYSSTRETHWVGYQVHLTETCDAGQPDLITQVITTPATTPDAVMGPTIHHDLAQRDLLPGTH
jgi:hypothetical protein